MFFLTCSTGLSAADWVCAVRAFQPTITKIRKSTTLSLLVILKLRFCDSFYIITYLPSASSTLP
jgi:hypothetical protein